MKIEIQVANDVTSQDFEELLVKVHNFLMREDVRPLVRDVAINPEFQEVLIDYSIRR